MQAKTFEVRDRGTFIPVLAVKCEPTNEADRYLFARSGYGIKPEQQAEYVIVAKLGGERNGYSCDPYEWGSGTMQQAHAHIIDNWDALESGDVICTEFLRGERDEPKQSEGLG
jgi:hypothetical protein